MTWIVSFGVLTCAIPHARSETPDEPKSVATSTKTEPKVIRWILAHEPVRVFERAARQFAEQVELKSRGKLKVEVLSATEFRKMHGIPKEFERRGLIDDVGLVQSGLAEMTQTYTSELGHVQPKMWVFDLPFLFRDHEHARRVLDGSIGREILSSVERERLKGFAFTYSGGYRVISTRDRGINKLSDFEGLEIRTARSPIARSVFSRLGAKPVAMSHDEGILKVKEGSLTAAETTIARFDEAQQSATPILNDTQHSLFLTAIVMNKAFFDGLEPDLQKAVEQAAREAAQVERQDSLADEAQLRKQFSLENKVKVVKLPAHELKKMKELTRPVFKEFEALFPADLVERIEKTRR